MFLEGFSGSQAPRPLHRPAAPRWAQPAYAAAVPCVVWLRIWRVTVLMRAQTWHPLSHAGEHVVVTQVEKQWKYHVLRVLAELQASHPRVFEDLGAGVHSLNHLEVSKPAELLAVGGALRDLILDRLRQDVKMEVSSDAPRAVIRLYST